MEEGEGVKDILVEEAETGADDSDDSDDDTVVDGPGVCVCEDVNGRVYFLLFVKTYVCVHVFSKVSGACFKLEKGKRHKRDR